MESIGYVNSIETFGLADGPGVRFVAFLQGCNMRCRYCHNPETWAEKGGDEYTAHELLSRALRYRSYWRDNGGITVSGGEPLLQMPFVTELFEEAHQNKIHTVLDTSAQSFSLSSDFLARFDRLMTSTDLVLLDIKAMNSNLHKSLTGFSNENILEAARYLSKNNIPVWIRHVLVPSLTDSDDELSALRDFSGSLGNVERVEILPYHTLGVSKWEKLNIKYTLKDVSPPSDEAVNAAKSYFT